MNDLIFTTSGRFHWRGFSLLLAFAAVALLLSSCKPNVAKTKPPDVDYYTCTMHPSVKSQDPNAKCPICSMDLVPVMKREAVAHTTNSVATSDSHEKASDFLVPVERQQQFGVTYGRIQRQPLICTIRATGIVASDKQQPWVWAQFYQDELPLVKVGLPVTITTSAYPGEKFPGRILSIDASLNESLRTARARIDLENPATNLIPNLYVDVTLSVNMGEGLAVPFDAVLPTGNHNIVFVDKDGGRLEPRFVELGRKYGDFYEVKSGLNEIERVVTSANFLIDAEAKVQGALKSW